MLKIIKTITACIIGLVIVTVLLFFYSMHTRETGLGALKSASKMALCIRLFKVEMIALVIMFIIMSVLRRKDK
jgi:hypothetical protein